MTTTNEDVLSRLRELQASLTDSDNKHGQAVTLIRACLIEGINTGSAIIATLTELGYDAKHAGIMLNKHCGNDPKAYHWAKLTDDTYRAH